MEINVVSISAEDQPFVDRLRRYLNDTVEQNNLTDLKESTDKELFEALQDALDDITITPPMIQDYKLFSEVPWVILRMGAVLNILTSKGLLSARNTLTYRDSGGVTVQDFDKYGRYLNYYNLLLGQYEKVKSSFKISKNIDGVYGEIPSEYSIT